MDFPLYHGASYAVLGADTADSEGTDITASVSTNVKGAWVSLGTIPNGVVGFDVIAHKQDGTSFLIDIGIGAAQNIVVPNLYIRRRLNAGSCHFHIPLPLPAGQTLYARCQSGSSSKIVGISVLCKIAGATCPVPLGVATDYGTDTSDTGGVTVDPGGTAHAKGSWTQIVASTARDIRQLLLMFGGAVENTNSPSTRTYASWLFDIGIGAAASEKIIIPNLGLVVASVSDCLNDAIFGPFDVNIPAGTRIAARCQSSDIDATYRLLDLTILGFD